MHRHPELGFAEHETAALVRWLDTAVRGRALARMNEIAAGVSRRCVSPIAQT